MLCQKQIGKCNLLTETACHVWYSTFACKADMKILFECQVYRYILGMYTRILNEISIHRFIVLYINSINLSLMYRKIVSVLNRSDQSICTGNENKSKLHKIEIPVRRQVTR